MATAVQIQADLDIVSTAITKLLSKESVSRVELGSGSSKTVYEMQEVSFEVLDRERTRLQAELAAVNQESKAFRTSSRVQLIFSK